MAEFHADVLLPEEKDFISNPEKWFYKLTGWKNKPFEELLARNCAFAIKDGTVTPGQTRRARPKTSKEKGYRFRRLCRSLLREDKRKPPLCILCFNEDPDVGRTCGRLLWCPEFPLFFAVHELCTLMAPEVFTVGDPTCLGKQLFNTDMKLINKAFLRGRLLTCRVCKEKGATLGCTFRPCRAMFHLPCAINSMCYINYDDFTCFCPRHSASAFNTVNKRFFLQRHEITKQENYECCICMEPVGKEIAVHSVIQTDCCGLQFYHFGCMKKATLIRGQEMRCPNCNRPNEQTDFEMTIKRQGIFFQTYSPVDDGTDGEYRSRCYYAMTRSSAKERSCLSSIGPNTYDDDDALDDRIFNPHEALNPCISCGVHCHRICAGEPWSSYNFDEEGDEEEWQCEDCRDAFSSPIVAAVPGFRCDSATRHLTDGEAKPKKKRSSRRSIRLKRLIARRRRH